MTDFRALASDATFLVLYIGFAGAMVVLSIALMLWSMYDSFTAHHSAAAAFNVIGWMVLPFMPGLYRNATGRPFCWSRAEAVAAY